MFPALDLRSAFVASHSCTKPILFDNIEPLTPPTFFQTAIILFNPTRVARIIILFSMGYTHGYPHLAPGGAW